MSEEQPELLPTTSEMLEQLFQFGVTSVSISEVRIAAKLLAVIQELQESLRLAQSELHELRDEYDQEVISHDIEETQLQSELQAKSQQVQRVIEHCRFILSKSVDTDDPYARKQATAQAIINILEAK